MRLEVFKLKKEFLAILFLSIILSLISNLFFNNLGHQNSLIISSFLLATFIAFTVNLIPKKGVALLFLVINGILTTNVYDFGLMGNQKIVTLLFVGLIFEVIYFFTYGKLDKINIDILIPTALSLLFIPIIIVLMLSSELSNIILTPLLNIIILMFMLSIGGYVVGYLVWFKLKTNKILVRFKQSF